MRRILSKLNVLSVLLLAVIVLSACEPAELLCEKGLVEVDGKCITEVVIDTVAPVFANVSDLAYTVDDAAPDYLAGFQVTDETDGNLLADVVVDDSAVDLTTPGTYAVTLTVEDKSGNEATATFNVVVTARPLTEQELTELDLAAIDFTTEIKLPSFTANGTIFYWKTSNPQVITNRGFVIPPPVSSGPVVVTLTATAVNGTYVATEAFDVTVQPWGEVSVTSKVSVPFIGTSEEYVVADKTAVDLFYVDNGTVPYIDVETFINMIDGAIEAAELTYTVIDGDKLELSYNVEFEDYDGTMVNETYTALIDFTLNTFTVDTFDFFENYVAATESDYGDGLNYVDADYVDSVQVTIPLGDYNFDLVIYDDNGTTVYLMPFAVTNLLFAGGVYYDAYFNGDEIYGVDTFSISGIDKEDPLWDEVRVSSLNTESMEKDMKWASYNFVALALDYFYGLKEDQGVDTYYETLSGHAQTWINGTDSDLYNGLFTFAYSLDDLHTSHVFPGFYQAPSWPGLSINDLGPRSKSFYEQGIWAMQDKLEAKYGSVDAKPDHRIIDGGKTAVIYFDGFTIDTPVEFKAILDALPTTVENVVIDLSYNTGGNVGAVFRMFGYMTEEQFTYHSQNPADDSAVTVYIESDYVAFDYNWYIISSKVSFSAANLMISMAKENGIATIMGTPSSGGASSIGNIFTPDGTSLLISTNSVLSTRVGNEVDGYEYLSIEYGVDPDYTMVNETSDSEIIAIIALDQAN